MASHERPHPHALHPRRVQLPGAKARARPHGQQEALPSEEHPGRVQHAAGGGVLLPLLPGRQTWVAARLQLAVSARGLRHQPARARDRRRVLPLLPGQADGAAGHGLLRVAQEGAPAQLPPPVPPHGDAHRVMGVRQVHARRPRHLHRLRQLLRAHCHVHLLPAGLAGLHEPLVEASRHAAAADPVLRDFHPLGAAVLLRLRLPPFHARAHAAQLGVLLLPVQGLLPEGLRAAGARCAALVRASIREVQVRLGIVQKVFPLFSDSYGKGGQLRACKTQGGPPFCTRMHCTVGEILPTYQAI